MTAPSGPEFGGEGYPYHPATGVYVPAPPTPAPPAAPPPAWTDAVRSFVRRTPVWARLVAVGAVSLLIIAAVLGNQSAPVQTPEQQLASGMVGTTDSTTGATVTSATVGLMCSSDANPDPWTDGSGCIAGFNASSGVPGYVPISQWQTIGVSTNATGEVQMSDGTQDVVIIYVDSNGNITWTANG